MNLCSIRVSEISQSKEDQYHMTLSHVESNEQNKLARNTNRLIVTEKRLTPGTGE